MSPGDHFKWLGMSLCMYSSMSNDSVQTLGTFMNSNLKVKLWKMWLFVGSLFVITLLAQWYLSGGRLDFSRLASIPYDPKHTAFHFLAPILLIILTYFKIPVSSTFLILSVFASGSTLGTMLLKTIFGYIVGIVLSFVIWDFLIRFYKNDILITGDKEKKWRTIQWLSSGINGSLG